MVVVDVDFALLCPKLQDVRSRLIKRPAKASAIRPRTFIAADFGAREGDAAPSPGWFT
ncbi:MAG TPA: hypothetical protein VLD16_14605 [Gaiellaceae bacterium]|nr:hypothetical protein [Gaiellaceae bacterium]